ncbi:MAG: DNA cytosine methyltransferase [Collinsella aerofaciens]|jgi:DNA (cytosine-5)-methyltransferase 1|nr:DNA cytosine methyltransferase [Collinsella aerofaciens]
MRYISLFSGIEAASVAWGPLGWEPMAFAEIEPFCCELLEKRFPAVPNLGDVSGVDWSSYRGKCDLIIGGSPCQAFSVAGNRKGLDDPRGRLMLEYARAVRDVEPRWVLWENVPGVLSQDGGAAFGTLLGLLEDCGYSLAWRVLDAQFFGVPQRRRRVFLVGHLRAQCASAVLFEPECVQGSAPSSAEKRQELAAAAGRDASSAGFIAGVSARARGIGYSEEQSPTLTSGQTVEVFSILGNAIGRKSENGPNGKPYGDDGLSPTLTTTDRHAVAFAQNQRDEVRLVGGDGQTVGKAVVESGLVRRLTPTECERLQGFPDGWTRIRDATPDGMRWQALGNSMAVPVIRWLGKRIQAVDEIEEEVYGCHAAR